LIAPTAVIIATPAAVAPSANSMTIDGDDRLRQSGCGVAGAVPLGMIATTDRLAAVFDRTRLHDTDQRFAIGDAESLRRLYSTRRA
jgi:hypothetical protein